jgi:hypothetical protein
MYFRTTNTAIVTLKYLRYNLKIEGGKKINKKILTFIGISILFLGTSITPSTGKKCDISFFIESNNPPYEPSNPIPSDGAENWSGNGLSWTGGDPDGDLVTYDIYLGTSSPPPLVYEDCMDTTYEPGIMNISTKYYWQIIAWDEHGASTKGPIWSFTTSGINHPPTRPEINITKGEKLGEINLTIRSIDPDGDNVLYYIDWGDGFFGDWYGPYSSGENVTITHSYPPLTGLYEGHAMAMDINNATSGWTIFYILILKTRTTSYIRYQFFLEHFTL